VIEPVSKADFAGEIRERLLLPRPHQFLQSEVYDFFLRSGARRCKRFFY